MARRKLVYEGKAKILYEGPEPGTLVQYFKDDATAFNAEKKDIIEGKGVLNNRLSEFFMTGLNTLGIPTHFIKRLNMREQLIRAVEIVPLEVIVRNYAAGTMSKRLGIEEGTALPRPIVEFCLKDDALTKTIYQTLDSLGAQSEAETEVAMESVREIWWSRSKRIPNSKVLLMRDTDVYNGVSPFLVPDSTSQSVSYTHLTLPTIYSV